MKGLKYLLIGYLLLMLLFIGMPMMLVLFSGGVEGLGTAATEEDTLSELIQLQRMGAPADVVMMTLSYLHDKDSQSEVRPIDVGLEYLKLCVMVEVLECDCDFSMPETPENDGDNQEKSDTPEDVTCSCDYEFDRVEEYATPDAIRRYLAVLGTPLEITAADIVQQAEQAAHLHCESSRADDRATTVFQPMVYSDLELAASLERCGVTVQQDSDGIVELHRAGAFIAFLAEQAQKFGISADDYIGQYPAPAAGAITCPFGYRIHPITNKPNFHRGIDIGTAHHTNIEAIAPGTVVGRGTDTYDGRYILLRHEGGVPFYSYYAHLSQWNVSTGDEIAAGDVIGKEGGEPGSDPEPGYSTGHHLHFEIRMMQEGSQINPLSFLKGAGTN